MTMAAAGGLIETPSGPVPASSSVVGLEATHAMTVYGSVAGANSSEPPQLLRRTEFINAIEAYGDGANEALNERAVSVMQRMSAKLTGRDGAPPGSDATSLENIVPVDSIEAQVERLICEATSSENLSLAYVGWCPWW